VALTASARTPVASHVSLMTLVLNSLNSHNLMAFYVTPVVHVSKMNSTF
jgi:hypothetical protein